MFKLQMENRARFAPICQDCDYLGNSLLCERCIEAIRTSYTCPKCGRSSAYFGDRMPHICNGCGVIFPDLEMLKRNARFRIIYHIDKRFS